MIQQQFEAIAEDSRNCALKTGMLHTPQTIENNSRLYKKFNIKSCCRPCNGLYKGHILIENDTINILKNKLFPLATIITPNIDETEILLDRKIKKMQDMEKAAMDLTKLGCQCALVKGGHLPYEDLVDTYYNIQSKKIQNIKSKKIDTINTHGTGCTLSAAIATELGKNKNIDIDT